MILGYLRTGQVTTLLWFPHTSKMALYHGPTLFAAKMAHKENGIIISDRPTAFHRYRGPESWHCNNCNILITGPVKKEPPL